MAWRSQRAEDSEFPERTECPGMFVMGRSCSSRALGQRKEQARNSPLSISLKLRNINETLLNSAWNRDADSLMGFLSFGLTSCMLSLASLCSDNTASAVNHSHGNLKLTQ